MKYMYRIYYIIIMLYMHIFWYSFTDDLYLIVITTTYCMKPYNIKGTARALYPVHVERAQYGQ